jgi:hypothetical protein
MGQVCIHSDGAIDMQNPHLVGFAHHIWALATIDLVCLGVNHHAITGSENRCSLWQADVYSVQAVRSGVGGHWATWSLSNVVCHPISVGQAVQRVSALLSVEVPEHP